ncbi:MAG: hypothetical protein JWP92_1113 [Caulobacter sp.]|nr:hypothetical protein [Caulobacter sp.]
MSPRRRPTTRLLTPMGWVSLVALAAIAAAFVAMTTLLNTR